MAMITVQVFLMMAIAGALAEPIKYYDSVLDNIDVEKMVTVPENLKMYTDCFLDKGPCDDIGARIRKVIQESIETACIRCSPSQKHSTRRFFEELVRQYPNELEALNKKYDPEFKYFFKFLEAVKDF